MMYQPGMLKPCMSWRKDFSIKDLEQIQRMDSYWNGLISKALYAGVGYVAVARDSSVGYIVSISKVGDLDLVKRYAAAEYCAYRWLGGTGSDVNITGINNHSGVSFPLAPGGKCPTLSCKRNK